MSDILSPETYANQVIERCASTNDLARKLGEAGYPHGAWVSARLQDSGRGRMGRRWESSDGNLFLSIVCRIPDRSLWTWVPLAAAVGVARSLPVSARIKWPNDVWIGGAKVGGILCEAIGNSEGSYIVCGIGLNCAEAPSAAELVYPATSLRAEGVEGWCVDTVRPKILDGVLRAFETLMREGSPAIARDYESRAFFKPGTPITWAGTSEASQEGEVLGLGPLGELRVRKRPGREVSLYAEDVKVRPTARTTADGSRS